METNFFEEFLLRYLTRFISKKVMSKNFQKFKNWKISTTAAQLRKWQFVAVVLYMTVVILISSRHPPLNTYMSHPPTWSQVVLQFIQDYGTQWPHNPSWTIRPRSQMVYGTMFNPEWTQSVQDRGPMWSHSPYMDHGTTFDFTFLGRRGILD